MRNRAFFLMAVVAVIVGACGSGEDVGSSEPPTPSVGPTTTTTTMPATVPTTGPGGVDTVDPWTLFTQVQGLPAGKVMALTIARDDAVWAAAAEPDEPFVCRLARFDGVTWTSFEPGPILENACVRSLHPAPSGGVMALVQVPTGDIHEDVPVVEFRIVEFTGTNWIDHSITHGLPNLDHAATPVMRTLQDGTVVVASHNHSPWDIPDHPGLTLFVYDGSVWRLSEAEKPFIRGYPWEMAWTAITIDNTGTGWMIEGGDVDAEGFGLGHVVELSLDGPVHHQLPIPEDEEDVDFFVWITTTPDGQIWASRGTTLHQYDGTNWFTHTPGDRLAEPSRTSGAAGEEVEQYHIGFGTSDGAFWISESSDVSVFRNGEWEMLEKEGEADLPGPVKEYYGAVVHGPDGSTWVIGDELHRYSDGQWKRVGVGPAVDHPAKVAIAADGTAWFATDSGVARFNLDTAIESDDG